MASSSREYERKSNLCIFFSFRELVTRHPRIMSKLMKWKQCNDDDQWSEKAVSTLVKMLVEKKGALEELERALSCPGTPTACITIPRSVDGRIQIKLRKGFPHVIYCRVWRWPDLQNHHELQSIPTCKFPYYRKSQEVCINPFHYVRVEANILPPVLVPKFNDLVPKRPLLPFQERMELTHLNFFGACSSLLQAEDPTLLDTLEPLFSVNEEMNVDAYLALQESQPPLLRSVAYEEQRLWASIAYYELNTLVGEKFNCTNPIMIVDGYANPNKDGERFSVGQFSNVQRNSSIERTRNHIGKGIRLENVNGQVYLECLSRSSVFIQSRLFNYANNLSASAVRKVLHEGTIKIFDNVEFSKLLNECANGSFESVFELTKMCIIRVSFVKGWGDRYHRVDVTSTPAWIEIHLHGPLICLDRVLVEMGGPNETVSSFF